MGETPELAPGFAHQLYRLDGKAALLMGGRGGLARAIAATLADLGCSVVLASRRGEECQVIADELTSRFGVRAAGMACDISKEADIQRTVGEAIERLGCIDILVNNAGVSWWGLPQDIPLTGWRKVVDVNLTGTFLSCRETARHMIPRGQGCIINVASVGAFLSYTPDVGQVVPYTTTKAALVHLTRDLAAQWAEHGIRVNAVAPGSLVGGMTETIDEKVQERLLSRILLKRFGLPTEVAGVIALLAAPAGNFITGQTFVIDGGQSIS